MCNQNDSFNEYDIEQKLINSLNYEKMWAMQLIQCMYPGLQLLLTMLHNERQTGRVFLEYSKQIESKKYWIKTFPAHMHIYQLQIAVITY